MSDFLTKNFLETQFQFLVNFSKIRRLLWNVLKGNGITLAPLSYYATVNYPLTTVR